MIPAACRAQVFLRGISSGTISGKVVFASNNRPAEHIRVQLVRANGGWGPTAFTGTSGEFEFEALPTGSYVLTVEESGYEAIQQRVDVDLGPQSVELRLNNSRSPVPEGPHYVISARELSIPPEAREAFDNAVLLLSKDNPSDALADLQRAIKRFPAYYEAYYQEGMANLQMDREEQAERAFRKSIQESGGKYPRAYVALGALLCDQGKAAEAENELRTGLELDEAPWLGHFFLARALFRLGRWDEAEKSALETTARNSELPETYLLLSAIHFNQNNYNAVLDDLNAYLKLDPNSSTANQAKDIQAKVRRALDRQALAAVQSAK